jgi:hypothetical protein
MSIFGGGGSSSPAGSSGNPASGPAAQAYQPTAQPGADIGFQNIASGFLGDFGPQFAGIGASAFPGATVTGPNAFSGTPGGVAYGYMQPFVGGAGTGTVTDPNDPYYLQNLQTAEAATGGVPAAFQTGGFLNALSGGLQGYLPAMFSGASSIDTQTADNAAAVASGLGGFGAYNIGPQLQSALVNQANLEGYGNQGFAGVNALNTALGPQAVSSANQGLSWLNAATPSIMTGAIGGANALNQYGNQILGTAFDPQGALYNQLQNQVAQQSNAAAASAGLGGSAYGASTVGNNLGNFNINWQNQQLARQAQGLGAAEPAFTTAAALPGGAATSIGQGLAGLSAGAAAPYQLGGALDQEIGQILQGSSLLPGNVASQYGQLGTQAAQLGAGAAQLPFQPLTSTMAGAAGLGSLTGQGGQLLAQGSQLAGLPYGAQTSGTSNALQALGNLINIGNQQYTIPQQVQNDLQSYLGLGQAASGLSGQLGALGLNEQAQSAAGLGSALGLGSNLLFGNQGLSGALGLGSGGLLGGLGGSSLGALAGTTAGNVALDTAAVDTGAIDSGLAGGAGAAAGGGGFGGLFGGIGSALSWIICTELVQQGRMPRRWWVVGAPVFAAYPESVKRGYYLWAIPTVRHLRRHPNSLYSRFNEAVFRWRAENIAAHKGVRGARKLLRGAAVTAVLYPLCMALGIFCPKMDWQRVYRGEDHARHPA